MFVNVSLDAKDAVKTLSALQFGSTTRQVSLSKAMQKNNRKAK